MHRYIQHIFVMFLNPNAIFQPMISASQPPGTPLLALAQASDGSSGEASSTASPSARERCWERARRAQKGVIKCQENIQGKEQREREGLGFQERHTVISKCFFALSGCLTKAAGEFYWRIRLVAFLWLLTSGGFGLCLESQWSNRHVCHFVEQSIDCGSGNNAFFSWREGCSCCGWSSCTCGRSLMFSTVAIILEAVLKNVREVSHELMEGNVFFF